MSVNSRATNAIPFCSTNALNFKLEKLYESVEKKLLRD